MRLHTTAEAAALLAVSPSFLKRGATARTLPHTRVGRFVRFSDDDLAEIVRRGRVEPVTTLRRRSA